MSITLKPDSTMGASIKPVAGNSQSIADGSDAQAIISTMERIGGASTIEVGGVSVAVLPPGKHLVSLKALRDEYATAPDRIAGIATLQDEASFVAHVNRFKDGSTALFCEPSFAKPSFSAVFDYHQVGGDFTRYPAFCAHRATWPVKLSKEWEAWSSQAGQWMSHAAFAEFLEQHAPDVYWGDERSEYTKLLIQTLELKLATTAQLVALSRNLAVNVETTVRSAQTLSSGEIALTYNEAHKDGEGQPIKVPNAFLIAIPVIYRGPTYQILARLRYRVTGGKILWSFELHRSDIVFDAAFDELQARIADATSRPVFRGSPEK